MTVTLADVAPGDVLCTRSKTGLFARLIRLGAALRDQPNTVNHVVVAHHVDEAGTFWGIEARPGGVGWVDLRGYTGASSPWTISNHEQPKTVEQRDAVCETVEGMLGSPYDWGGIAQDAMKAITGRELWHSWRDGGVPTHVVCSSLADWAYDHVGLASPGAVFDRDCSPADWEAFIVTRGWVRS